MQFDMASISEETPLHFKIENQNTTADLEDIESYIIYKEYDESLYNVVINEIYAMLNLIFFKNNSCLVFYNPLYTFAFMCLFIIIMPSVFLHWLLIDFVPIRVSENSNEREFRSQGIYTATGCCLFSVIYSIICIEQSIGNTQQQTLHGVYLYTYLTIIIINMIALKAIADQLYITMKIYILSVWLMDFIMYALFMCNIYKILHLPLIEMTFSMFINIFMLFVCTVIATNSVYFWNFYCIQSKRKQKYDSTFAFILMFLATTCLFLLILLILKYAKTYFQFINKS